MFSIQRLSNHSKPRGDAAHDRKCFRISIHREHFLRYSCKERVCSRMSMYREHVLGYSYRVRMFHDVHIAQGTFKTKRTSPRKLALSIQWLSDNVVNNSVTNVPSTLVKVPTSPRKLALSDPGPSGARFPFDTSLIYIQCVCVCVVNFSRLVKFSVV